MPSSCSVGISREIPFEALISRQPANDINSIKWTCSPENCEDNVSAVNSSSRIKFMAFPSEGEFELKSEISINEITKTSTSIITVDGNVIPHVQIKYFPKQPINTMQSNDFVMTILNLIPKCIAFWNVVKEEGFEGFVKGFGDEMKNLGYVIVKDFEEYFLQELVDYDNNTLSQVSLSNLFEFC